MTPKEFFEAALQHRKDACLIWPFNVGPSGYPRMASGKWGVKIAVHREVCRRVHGEPPTPKHNTAHWCGIRRCIAPAHVRWATQTENVADKKRHGTYNQGGDMLWSKLTEADVRAIRADPGTVKEVAERFGIHFTAVSKIRLRQRWKHI